MPGAGRHTPAWPWVFLLVTSAGLAGAIVWKALPRLGDPLSVGPAPIPQAVPAQPIIGERRRIRLYFPQESGEAFREQEREIPRRATLSQEVRAVLQELAIGSEPGIRPPIPQGTDIRQIFLDAFGIAYLDLGKGILNLADLPEAKGELAVWAIVTTLTASFSEIKRVQFLAEGKELEATVGTVDLRRPVSPRFPGDQGLPRIPPSQE
jgi:hypothetical protein